MATLASSLLEFILDLLRDPDTAADFQDDPQGVLAAAGLDDVSPADVQNLIPVLADCAPMGGGAAGLAHVAPAAQVAAAPVAAAAVAPQVIAPQVIAPQVVETQPTDDPDAVSAADSSSVIAQLQHIQQTFTYTANTTIDIRDSVWAGRDVYQIFGDEAVLATGGSVAAGDDAEDVSVDHSVEIEDSFTIDDSFNPDIENSGNTVDGDGNAVGRGNDVDNSDRSDNRDNSVSIDDSLNGNTLAGGDVQHGDNTTVETDVEDSFNDNSTNLDVDVEDSFNDNSTDLDVDDSFNDESTDLDVEVDDVVLGDGSAGGDLDNSLEVEDSGNTTTDIDTTVTDNFNGNALAGDDQTIED